MNNDYLKIEREVDPACRLPEDLDTTVWRYMNYNKFCSLIDQKALYLCRADLLKEKFEGTYSRVQIDQMHADLKSWGHKELISDEQRKRKRNRERTYISCWCVSDIDLDLMWKAYTPNGPAVAIESTVGRLQQICDNAVELWPLDISLVNYVDLEVDFINYPGIYVFLHKDVHFKLDNELRIVHWPNMVEPTPDHTLLPVSLEDLIVTLVIKPGAPIEFVESVKETAIRAGLDKIPIEFSRYERDPVE